MPKPCDLSDEKRVAVLGQHEIIDSLLYSGQYYTIPIIDAKYPSDKFFISQYNRDYDTHDFVIFVLKCPAKFSRTVQPLCLPRQDQDFSGVEAVAAGWGLTESKKPSSVLRAVNLTVDKEYKHFNFFGTKLEKNSEGVWKSACSGDSGMIHTKKNVTKSRKH